MKTVKKYHGYYVCNSSCNSKSNHKSCLITPVVILNRRENQVLIVPITKFMESELSQEILEIITINHSMSFSY
jgi:hypothetical protein